MRGRISHMAWQRLRADRVGVAALSLVLLFVVMVIASSSGWLARTWQQEVAEPSAPPNLFAHSTSVAKADTSDSPANTAPLPPRIDLSAIDPLAPYYAEWAARAATYPKEDVVRATSLPFGADRLGRDVLNKAIKGAEVSITVGVLAALLATVLGTVFGALGGFLGGKVGDALEWLYNVFTAIPGILLVFMFAAVLNRSDSIFPRGVVTLTLILGLTSWTGVYRLVRAEFIKHAGLDYVRAAQALGASRARRMFVHILPNVNHVALVQLSVLVVGCIKAEVILSYLGLGVAVDQVSWGSMLAEAQSELLLGHWWQLAVATVFMALFVTAFSFFTDALRDALDPRLRPASTLPAR
jgi:oligopeptide transport system permease protein